MQRTPWDEIAYSNVEYWAEPDIAQAAKTIRQLYYNKALRQEIGSAAKEFMAKMYSTENFRKSAIALLESSKYCSSAMQHFGYNMEASNRPKRI